ncbi:MAG: DUF7009 family protein [Flavobacteriales bacterium]
MKIRIRGNSIRLRLTQHEVELLSSGQKIKESTQFSLVHKLEYALQPWHLNIIEASLENHSLTISVPADMLAKWSESNEEGLYGEQSNGTDSPLKIAIEKDYACLKPRDGEDESDHFPHPESGTSKC